MSTEAASHQPAQYMTYCQNLQVYTDTHTFWTTKTQSIRLLGHVSCLTCRPLCVLASDIHHSWL